MYLWSQSSGCELLCLGIKRLSDPPSRLNNVVTFFYALNGTAIHVNLSCVTSRAQNIYSV